MKRSMSWVNSVLRQFLPNGLVFGDLYDNSQEEAAVGMSSKVLQNVSRVNHSLSSTASQGTSNIPFPWFLLLGCNRQAQDDFLFFFFSLYLFFSFPNSSFSLFIFFFFQIIFFSNLILCLLALGFISLAIDLFL